MLSVSVVIPAFNAAHMLGDAIASALAQTRAPHEVLVVDDGSTDDTAAVAARWAARDPRVRLLRQERNQGNSAARNRGAREAAGDLYAVLDADDVWEPCHLEEVAALLDRYPEAVAAGAAARYTGTRTGVWTPRFAAGAPQRIFWEALVRPPLQHSTCIFRRDVLLAAGGYDESQQTTADVDLFMRLAYEHPFVCTHRVTCDYRWHAGQISSNAPRQIHSVYHQRRALLERLRGRETPEFVARYEQELRALWRREVGYAVEHHRAPVLRALIAQWRHVPGVQRRDAVYWHATSTLRRAGRRGARAAWGRVPAPVQRLVKRLRPSPAA